jgi:outer membrane protein TolC
MIGKREYPAVMMIVVAVLMAGPAFAGDVVRLSPEKCAELAKTQSVVVKASNYNVKAKENEVKSAFTGFLPTISGSASATHLYDKPQMELGGGGSGDLSTFNIPYIPGVTDSIDGGDKQIFKTIMSSFSNIKIETPNNMYNATINIGQPIFAGGRILNGYRAAKFGLEAQKYTHDRTVTETGFTAQKIFWGYVGALKGLEAVQETRQWFETLLKDQQKMYDNGLIIELDILNSKIQLDNFKLAEYRMRNSIRTVADQLLVFLGLPQESLIDADTAMLTATAPGAVSASSDSIDRWLAQREDLMAMSSQIKALRSLKGLQLGSYWPMVSAFGSYGATNQYSTNDKDLKPSSSVGVQLSLTLLDWGKAWREAQKVQCQMQAAQLQTDNMRDMIRLKYFELARKVDESAMACAIAREDLETAQKALKIAKLKYDAQAITNTELLNTRTQLTGKFVAFTQARINVILAVEEFKIAPLNSGASQQMQ